MAGLRGSTHQHAGAPRNVAGRSASLNHSRLSRMNLIVASVSRTQRLRKLDCLSASHERLSLFASYVTSPCLLVASLWVQLHSMLHHDPAWLIHGTEVFLSGGKLYRDVFELNPPLIFYLTVPPVWLANRLHVFDVSVFIIHVFFLISISLSSIWALLRRDASLSPLVRNGFVLASAVTLAIYPAGNFGQREHLMLVLSLPYLFLIASRSRRIDCSRSLATIIGTLAALGFALKPHFLIVPATVELYHCILT